MKRTAPAVKPMIGWREWVALPQLGVANVKAKVDTGARSSAIHAHHIQRFERDGQAYVRFLIKPLQDDAKTAVQAEALLHEKRMIKSSTGHETLRPVIITPITLMGRTFDIELTLTNRDEMGFRMLLGRSALRRRFLIDCGKSFLAGQPDTLLLKKKKP